MSAIDPRTARPLVLLSQVDKSYLTGAMRNPVIREASLEVDPGQFVAVLGPSGSGKTTLLNLIGGLDMTTHGRVLVAGVHLSASTPEERVEFRRKKVGFVFQFYNLFPTLNAVENVQAGLEVCDLPRVEIQRRSHAYLDAVGLLDRARAFPHELSGGEQQRVAIARALAKEPPLVLADEPTGNLDPATGDRIIELMKALNRRTGTAFIVATHNSRMASVADRVIHLRDGTPVEN